MLNTKLMKDTTIIWIFGASPLFLHVLLQKKQTEREEQNVYYYFYFFFPTISLIVLNSYVVG